MTQQEQEQEHKQEVSDPIPIPVSAAEAEAVPKVKSKRDIIRFNGEKPTAINLEHVNIMSLDGKKITFDFYTKSQFVDFADEKAAASIFEILVNTWSSTFEK